MNNYSPAGTRQVVEVFTDNTALVTKEMSEEEKRLLREDVLGRPLDEEDLALGKVLAKTRPVDGDETTQGSGVVR